MGIGIIFYNVMAAPLAQPAFAKTA